MIGHGRRMSSVGGARGQFVWAEVAANANATIAAVSSAAYGRHAPCAALLSHSTGHNHPATRGK